MDSEDFSLFWTAAGDQPSTPLGSVENWIQLEEKYKKTIEELKTRDETSQYAIKYLKSELAAANESEVVKKYQEKMADLEKERDNWKKMAEEEAQKNKEVAEEMADLMKELDQLKNIAIDANEKVATFLVERKKIMDEFVKQRNFSDETIKTLTAEKTNLEKQLLERDAKMETLLIKWENNLASEKAINAHQQEKYDQLKVEITELKREEALVNCKICMDRPVQIVFPCGHAACSECFGRVENCHLCRKRIGRMAKKIFFT